LVFNRLKYFERSSLRAVERHRVVTYGFVEDMISMLFHRFWLRSLFALGLIALLGAPSFAQIVRPDTTVQGKKGGDPPRPKPKPGPREGGDGD
jgi:hypothetical protein